MYDELQLLLQLVGRIPVWTVYLLVAAGTAVENVFPPIPSDSFVILGAILAEERLLDYPAVFAVAWTGNVGSAFFVYLMGRRHGQAIFSTRWGERLLRPHQMNRLAGFYERYGIAAVFFSRFVPVFRVLVPAFAGVSRMPPWRTGIPLALASALWYAALLAAGGLAARNIPRLVALLGDVNWTLWVLAGAVALAVGAWWWRSRHEGPGEGRRARRGDGCPRRDGEA